MEVTVVDVPASPAESTVIVGVMEGLNPAPGSEDWLEPVDIGFLEASGFEGKARQLLKVPHPDAGTLLCVGLGEEVSFLSLRAASGNAIRSVKTERAVSYLAGVDLEQSTRAVVEGSVLGAYKYRDYKSDDDPGGPVSLEVVGGDDNVLDDTLQAAAATILARDWINTPAMDQSPEALADSYAETARGAGIEAEIWDRARIESEGLGGLLGVAAGSSRDPRLVKLTYVPDGPKAHLVLVGKGITFDSGGLSLKPAASMEEMKDDMSGSAVVTAATVGIASLGLPVAVTCITPLTDNAVGGNATRPGDVLKPLDGPTIEVLNTDAEGRLILADGLSLAKELEADLIIDVATLTGAARVALGDKIVAVFASDTDVAAQVLEAASVSGEHFWEMPLFHEYRKSIDSNIADIKNVSAGRYGGAITAAIFLNEYRGDGPWAHLDIAGPARARETSGETVKGASGVAVRTLIELAREMSQTG